MRPEFVSLADDGIPVDIVKVADAGRYRIVETRHAGHSIKLLVPEGDAGPGKARRISPSIPRIRRSMKTAGWWVRR